MPLGAVTAFAAEVDETQPPTEEPTDATEAVTEVTTEPTEEATEAPTEATTEPVTEPVVEETEPAEETTPTEEPPPVMMFAASPASDTNGGSSGSETGDGGDGGGNSAGDGSSNMIAVGVTMQVVYYRYDQCYNRYNSHGSVINTLQNYKAIPWNDSGKDQGATATTVFDTYTISPHTFIVKARYPSYPYVYHFPNETCRGYYPVHRSVS